MAADESLIIVSGRLLRSQFISLNTFHQTENYTKIKAASGQQKRTKIVLANKCSCGRTPLHHVCSTYCSSPLCHQVQAISSPPCSLYLRFPGLLIVSMPCYCLPLLGINLSNKLGSLQRRQVCQIRRSPHPLLRSHGCSSLGIWSFAAKWIVAVVFFPPWPLGASRRRGCR